MTNSRSNKRALFCSLMALLVCFTMLLGTTFAWFTDSVTSSGNKIVAGDLKVELWKYTAENTGTNISGVEKAVFDDSILWEPGMTQVAYLGVKNTGNLALKYKVLVSVSDGVLTEVLDYAIVTNSASYGYVTAWDANAGQDLKSGLNETAVADVVLEENGDVSYFALVVHMDETAGNEYMNKSVTLDVKILATQASVEEDAFGSDYDANAEYAPYGEATGTLTEGDSAVELEVRGENGVKIGTAVVPATALSGDDVKLVIVETSAPSNITVAADEAAKSFDVKVLGLKENNDTPVKVTLNIPANLDPATVKLYHYAEEMDCTYNPNTGIVTFESATFSPFTVVYDAESEFEAPEVEDSTNKPQADVQYKKEYVGEGKITWGNYGQWSPTEGLEADLEAAFEFKCPEEFDEAYRYWYCDFYVSLDAALGANQLFLGGNYGSFGWVGFHNGDLELEANTEIGLLEAVTTNPWTYDDVENYVGTFICGVGDVDDALEGATFTVKLRLTNPENENEYIDANVVTYTFGGSAVIDGATVVTSAEDLQDAFENGGDVVLGGDIDLNDLIGGN